MWLFPNVLCVTAVSLITYMYILLLVFTFCFAEKHCTSYDVAAERLKHLTEAQETRGNVDDCDRC